MDNQESKKRKLSATIGGNGNVIPPDKVISEDASEDNFIISEDLSKSIFLVYPRIRSKKRRRKHFG